MNVLSRPSTSRSGAGSAERLLLADVGDVDVAVLAAVEDRLDQVREVADAEVHVDDARVLELADDDLEDRLVADRHQRLRQHRGVRREPRAAAAGQDDRLHVAQAALAVHLDVAVHVREEVA